MPSSPTPLKGSRQPRHAAALLLIDWISNWLMEGGAQLRRQAEQALPAATRLLAGARRQAVPVIYANDNHGQWRSDFRRVLAESRAAGPAAAAISDSLAPAPDDYFVLKPKHSAFRATPLGLLLQHLHTEVVVLSGIAGNLCVLASAIDAHMRDLRVIVVADACASLTAAANKAAMTQCRAFGCGVQRSASLRWRSLGRSSHKD